MAPNYTRKNQTPRHLVVTLVLWIIVPLRFLPSQVIQELMFLLMLLIVPLLIHPEI